MGAIWWLHNDPDPSVRPGWLGVLGYLGGLLVGMGGLLQASLWSLPRNEIFGMHGGQLILGGTFGFLGGLAIALLSGAAGLRPGIRRRCGGVVLVLALATFPLSLYGLFGVGTLLAVASGTSNVRRVT
jgi:hypothetical protein